MPKQPQFDLLEPERIWQLSLLAKVKGLIDYRIYEHLAGCGQQQIFKTCTSCGDWSGFWSHCNLKFCPVCNWRIARRRAELLKLWTVQVKQPKHVVLTMKNYPVLTKREIRLFQSAFGKLRRSAFFRQVDGGCVSIEITNEGRGWHIHGHVLCNVRFLPVEELAIRWGKLVGQAFGVVYVKDCRGTQYLHEVTKYCVKPAQMLSWPDEQIAQFIYTVSRCRLFTTFGPLFKLRRQLSAQIANSKPDPEPCKCGCEDFRWSTEESEALADARKSSKQRR